MGVYDKDIKRDIDAINALLKGVKPSKKVMLEDFPLQQIYYGAPGTGKSFELKEVTKGYSTIRTTFHPDSDYSTFVGVYKPTMEETPVYGAQGVEVAKEKRITYTYVKQAFLKAYLGAWQKYAYGGETAEPQFLVIEALRPAILSDVRKCQKPNTQGFSFLLWCFIVPHNAILSLLIRVHFRVRRFSLLIFVYTGLYKLLKRSIAFAFNSSTIAI